MPLADEDLIRVARAVLEVLPDRAAVADIATVDAAVGIPVDEVSLSFQDLVLYEKELVGSRASAGEMHHVIPLVLDGRIRVKEILTHTFGLDDFAEGLAVFNERRDGAIKVVFES